MQTVKQNIKFSGIGVHSGVRVNITVKRAKKYGIFFKRVDIAGADLIPATYDNVSNTGLWSTSVGRTPNQAQTIEHFMAALFVCGIDSAIIEIDGPEFPIMDGGASQFIKIFKKAGAYKPWAGKKIIIKKTVIAHRQEIIKKMPFFTRLALWLHNLKSGRREDGYVRLSPGAGGLGMDVTLDYPDRAIGKQNFKFKFDGSKKARDFFETDISKSRTFGRLWEWGYMKKHGMGQGATEDNLIVLMDRPGDWDNLKNYVDNEKQLKKVSKNIGNDTLMPLFWADEFVRHKLIDAVGDLFTSGGFIHGHLESYKGSHGLNNLVLKKLFSDPTNYDIIK